MGIFKEIGQAIRAEFTVVRISDKSREDGVLRRLGKQVKTEVGGGVIEELGTAAQPIAQGKKPLIAGARVGFEKAGEQVGANAAVGLVNALLGANQALPVQEVQGGKKKVFFPWLKQKAAGVGEGVKNRCDAKRAQEEHDEGVQRVGEASEAYERYNAASEKLRRDQERVEQEQREQGEKKAENRRRAVEFLWSVYAQSQSVPNFINVKSLGAGEKELPKSGDVIEGKFKD